MFSDVVSEEKPLKTNLDPVREMVDTVEGWVTLRLVMKSITPTTPKIEDGFQRQCSRIIAYNSSLISQLAHLPSTVPNS